MRKFHSLFESTQGHRAYFNAASAEPLQEASIAKMNRRAKDANAVDSKNPGSKNYSPKEISMIKKAVEDEADAAGLPVGDKRSPSSLEVKDGNVYLTVDHGDERPQHYKVESYCKTDGEPLFYGWQLRFLVTIGKGGKMQYVLSRDDGKVGDGWAWRGGQGWVDYFADKIIDGANAAVKSGGLNGLARMIRKVLDDNEIDDFWRDRREYGYGWGKYQDDYPNTNLVGIRMGQNGEVYKG